MKGHCNCRAVRFEVVGEVKDPSFCHCGQCRRQSGGVWSSAFTEESEIHVQGDVRWFRSSASALRGFCPICGSFLFWKQDNETTMSFALGALEGPTGLRLEKHIFVADKGDYYQIADDAPQEEN